MADADEPLVARDFQVRLIVRGPRGGVHDDIECACSRVVLPSLRLDDPVASASGAEDDRPASRNLVLHRGHTGSPEWFTIWRAARDRDRHQLRDVVVTVLDAALRPALAWHFSGCRVVALDHSPLDALEVGVLVERLEIAFDAVEQVGVRTTGGKQPPRTPTRTRPQRSKP